MGSMGKFLREFSEKGRTIFYVWLLYEGNQMEMPLICCDVMDIIVSESQACRKS